MCEYRDPAEVTGTSSEAAERATGKPWPEWMALLDAAGGREMTHKELVACVARHHRVSAWWQQHIAVAYENSRGLRRKHEMPGGYQISRSRTLDVGAARVFLAWADDDERRRWLPGAKFTLRKVTPDKSLRLIWSDGTLVEVRLAAKGDRTQITVQHSKLPDAAAAERMKTFWAEALDSLAKFSLI